MNENQYGRVSVIIPARNEELNIARVVRSLAKQPGIREILVVDDQSTDQTGEILAALEAEIPLLRTLRVESLPEGWLGKTHAVAQAARAATGDWLLFTDADTEHQAGSLAELLQRAEDEHADLLSLSPGQETPTWWEKSVIPLVYVKLASLFRFEEVSDPHSPAAAANGQYLLVRREIYERSGGHEAVKSAILEDVELARRIKAQGGNCYFCRAPSGFGRACTTAFVRCGRAGPRISIFFTGATFPRCLRRLHRSGFWICSRYWLLWRRVCGSL